MAIMWSERQEANARLKALSSKHHAILGAYNRHHVELSKHNHLELNIRLDRAGKQILTHIHEAAPLPELDEDELKDLIG